MKILVVYTAERLRYGKSRTAKRINTLVRWLSLSNEIVLIEPSHAADVAEENFDNLKNVYYFKEWSFISNLPLHYFSDFNVSLLRKIRAAYRREKPDLVFISHPFGIGAASIICDKTPIIYEAHDVTSDMIGDFGFRKLQLLYGVFKLPVISSVTKGMLNTYLYWLDNNACHRAAHIITISLQDKNRFVRKHHVDANKISVLPSFMELAQSGSVKDGPARLDKDKINVGFVGTYGFLPSKEAFDLIVDYIAPEIAKRDSRIQFLLAGIDLPRFEKDNVKALGYVSDLAGFFQNLDIAILPAVSGTGVAGKLVDYITFGLPSITTKRGARGVPIINGEHAVIVDTVNQEFIDAILKLANDEKERQRLRRNCLELVAKNYSEESLRAQLNAAVTVALKRQG